MGDTTQPPGNRRQFLCSISGTAAGGLALSMAGPTMGAENVEQRSAVQLPTLRLGKYQVTRLIAGWNPIGGYSHTTRNMARVMREYFTVERVVEFLQKCESEGINTWQFDHTEKGIAAIQRVRELGSQMHFICLHAERSHDAPIPTVVKDSQPIAIMHHGGVTDAKFRAGRQQDVHDFVKKVHDHGLLAGVSSHNPDNIRRIADADWENDFFMCCFYFVSRTRDEQQAELGTCTVGEPFLEYDPVRMTEVIRQVDKPCLGFKILAAGRLGWSQSSVRRAFQFAFQNIKPTDGVIVGLFPKYHDEVREAATLTRQFGAVA